MRKRPDLVLAATLVGGYGPLSLHEPAVTEPPSEVARRCFPDSEPVKVVGGEVRGRAYFSCYKLDDDGSVLEARVVDGQGFAVSDAGLVKESGAWPWIATVDNATDLVLGAVGLVVLLWVGWIYGRRGRPPATEAGPWWAKPGILVVLALVPFLGWIVLAVLPDVDRRRKARAAFQAVFVFAGLILFGFPSDSATKGDTWGLVVNGLLAAPLAVAVIASATLRPAVATVAPAGPEPRQTQPVTTPASAAPSPEEPPPFAVQGPAEQPTFADVGGMAALKTELKDTFGLMLAFAGEARAYRLRWNGLLLHGPPGVGKPFIAKAAAGGSA